MRSNNTSYEPTMADHAWDIGKGMAVWELAYSQSKSLHVPLINGMKNVPGRFMQWGIFGKHINKAGRNIVGTKLASWAPTKGFLHRTAGHSIKTLATDGGQLAKIGINKIALDMAGGKFKSKVGSRLLTMGVRRFGLIAMRASGVASGLFWAQLGGSLAFGAAKNTYNMAMEEKGVEWTTQVPFTHQMVTSRQRAVRAITESRLQAKSAIGNEARMLHR